MPETATKQDQQTREMFMVAYYMSDAYGRTCSWCDQPAFIRIEATPEKLTDYACEDCGAGHIRSNADVLGSEE